MRLRLLGAAPVIVLLAACGSGDGSGTRPTIGATLQPGASIGRSTSPAGPAAGTSPPDAQLPETQPEQPPVATAPPETQPEEPPADTAAPDTAPSSSVALVGDDDDSIVWLPWALLGALVVVGAGVALSRRRRPGPYWQTRTTTLLDDIDQLTSHLVALTPDGLHAVANSDATALATMRAALADLIASAPDANRRMALGMLTTPVAELHGAVDAIALSAGPSIEPESASVAQIAARLHTASASVRAELAVHR